MWDAELPSTTQMKTCPNNPAQGTLLGYFMGSKCMPNLTQQPNCIADPSPS